MWRRERLSTVAFASVLLTTPGCRDEGPSSAPADPTIAAATYVADATCHECHGDEQRAWLGSHHHLAMQVATPGSVAGDFDDATFMHEGVETRFFRRDGRFFVHTEGADGVPADFEVSHVFGVEPLQQVLIELDRGRVQCLTVAWDREEERWFSLYDERFPPGDPMHWTGLQQNWNFMCAECHSTDLRRGWDDEAATYHTTWAEISVGCQACHGPGSRHVDWANAFAGHVAELPPSDPKGLVVALDAADSRVQIEECARCHSRRSIVTESFRHGDRFLDHYDLALPTEPLYHADGQIRDEVYVYGSFLLAKKASKGVRCTDCHDPHSARLVAEGNALCVQCHSESPPERFPSIVPKQYDDPSHHHHPAAGAGTRCVDCHMIERTYMVVDPRRDHSFRVPRPDLSATLGTPNACNDCHDDRDPAWAAAAITDWNPTYAPPPHWSEAVAAVDRGEPDAAERLAAVAEDLAAPAIVRATALERLFRGPPLAPIELLSRSLEDNDPLVRTAAVRAVEAALPPGVDRQIDAVRVELLVPRLDDSVRLVRAEAARVLSGVPRDRLAPAARAAFDRALQETIDRNRAQFDRPDGHFNLALLRERLGAPQEAVSEYRTAIERDSTFVPARFNLANLLSRLGRNAEAEEHLRAVVAADPLDGEGHYSLGLLLVELGRLEEAATCLDRAASFLPDRPRVRYNLGLLWQELGRLDAAESALREAIVLAPGDPDVLYALVLLLLRGERFDEAQPLAEELVRLVPEDPRLRALLGEIVERQGE